MREETLAAFLNEMERRGIEGRARVHLGGFGRCMVPLTFRTHAELRLRLRPWLHKRLGASGPHYFYAPVPACHFLQIRGVQRFGLIDITYELEWALQPQMGIPLLMSDVMSGCVGSDISSEQRTISKG